jgi:CDP-glucose 4,6-dehydratase
VGFGQRAVESLDSMSGFYKNKNVFITGHTGFKGAWLTAILARKGATVTGYALAPINERSCYVTAGIEKLLHESIIGDIRDEERLKSAISAAKPEVVFHLAAQPLVRASYRDPRGTFETNVIGTTNVFEAIRVTSSVRSIVNVTTDKVYRNEEWAWPYRESDPLGGGDPYSASKACAEIVTESYRKSFFSLSGAPALASARAGNVIGGGDWSADRLVPDLFRVLFDGETTEIRNPDATRPWQHVIEPLFGYLRLAELLCLEPSRYSRAYNFGPDPADVRPVRFIVDYFARRFPEIEGYIKKPNTEEPKEARLLALDNSLAMADLGWRPRWRVEEALDATIEWAQVSREGGDLFSLMSAQIDRWLAR